MINPGDRRAKFLTVQPMGPATNIIGHEELPKHKPEETYIRLSDLLKLLGGLEAKLISGNEWCGCALETTDFIETLSPEE